MDLKPSLRPDAPWLQLLVAPASEVYDAASALEHDKHHRVASRVLRGRKMRKVAGLFDEMAAALQFPPYFGENWDALNDCLGDLEWLAADTCVITILDAVHLLDQESSSVRGNLREILQEIGGEAAAQPGKRIRVLLQCTAAEEAAVRGQWPLPGGPRTS